MRGFNILLEIHKMQKGVYNAHAARIVEAHKEASKIVEGKKLIIAGGCIIDAAYQLESYDIDCYISSNNFVPNYLVGVEKTKDFDIVHISDDITVEEYILTLFDQSIKKCWYDGERFYFSDACLRSILNNELNIDFINTPSSFFRALRACKKYDLDIKQSDLIKLEHFAGWALNSDIYNLSSKYKEDARHHDFSHIKIDDPIAKEIDAKYYKFLQNALAKHLLNKKECVIKERYVFKSEYNASTEKNKYKKTRSNFNAIQGSVDFVMGFGTIFNDFERYEKKTFNGRHIDESDRKKFIPIEEKMPIKDKLLQDKVWCHNVGTGYLDLSTNKNIVNDLKNIIELPAQAQLCCTDTDERITSVGMFIKGKTIAVSLSDCNTLLTEDGRRYIRADSTYTFVDNKKAFISAKEVGQEAGYGEYGNYCEAVVEEVEVIAIWCYLNIYKRQPSLRYELDKISKMYNIPIKVIDKSKKRA